jgi:agmatinase
MTHFGDIPKQYAKLKEAEIVVLPIPYDGTSTWGKGADKGPEAILEASANMELYDIETDSEVYHQGIFTAPPVTEDESPEAMVEAGYLAAKKYVDTDKFLVTLGGEHSISYGPIKAYFEKYPDLTVLQLDAHTDLRDEYLGSKYNHACVMARAQELCPVVQVGIRSMDVGEKERVVPTKIFWAHELQANAEWMERAVGQLSENVYLTIDLDVFDPAIMPSTGTPEPGGMLWYQVLEFLRIVQNRTNIVGMDIVELAPNKNNKAPDFLAAKLLYKILSYKYKDAE